MSARSSMPEEGPLRCTRSHAPERSRPRPNIPPVSPTQIGADADRIVVRFFDMVTIAVPPALPACLTIATVFSIGRLRKRVSARCITGRVEHCPVLQGVCTGWSAQGEGKRSALQHPRLAVSQWLP